MIIRWHWWYLFYGLVWLALGFLSVSYFRGAHWPTLYGSFVHSFSRLHLIFVHATVGCLILLASVEGSLFFNFNMANQLKWTRLRFHHLAHICTLVAIGSGLLMELIERYPNPLIAAHMKYALLCYAGLTLFSSLCFWSWAGRWRLIAAVGLITIVVNTAHLGGIIEKGLQFFN